MKAIIPAAGIGTRLRPHTHTMPKVLMQVAGKPIIGHILDELIQLGIDEVTIIIGYMGDRVREYLKKKFKQLKVNYVEQEERKGLGHAIYLSAKYHPNNEPVLIILGDTIFKADLRSVISKKETYIGVKEVEDPRRFGIVELDGNRIVRLVEKPSEPKTNLAIVGLYYIWNTKLLFEALTEIIAKNITTKGEFQLTDALQVMLDKGEVMRVFPIEGWYDCGKAETLLQTNKVLLSQSKSSVFNKDNMKQTVIIPPVFIDESVKIKNSVIGPYVSIAEGSSIENSIVRDSIINEDAEIKNILLEESIIGDNACVSGNYYRLNVGDSSEFNIK